MTLGYGTPSESADSVPKAYTDSGGKVTLSRARVPAPREPLVDGLAAAVRLFFGIVDQVELARRSAITGEKRRRLGSVVRPVIQDMYEHLPDGHPFVDVRDEVVR
jgi:hypothetical protein